MTKLEEAAKKFMDKQDFVQDGYFAGLCAFAAGVKWIQAQQSCCCGGCTKHNIAITSEKQNSEFDKEV